MSSLGTDGLLDIDWDAPFDFDSFINFPPEADEQGGQEGIRSPGTGLSERKSFDNAAESGGMILLDELDQATDRDVVCKSTGDIPSAAALSDQVPTACDSLLRASTDSGLTRYDNQSRLSTLAETTSESITWKCACFICYYKYSYENGQRTDRITTFDGKTYRCRIPGCDWAKPGYKTHGDRHFMERRHDSTLKCTQAHCKFTTRRFYDMERHYRSKHCREPKLHSCPVAWCKYSGDNGFTRNDKLKSHYRNIHQGNHGRSRPPPKLQPALAAATSTDGNYTAHAGLASENDGGAL